MINSEGYLSVDINEFEKNIEREYSFVLDKIRKYNKFFQSTVFIFKGEKKELAHWCLFGLYIRALSTYQSIVLMSKKGITNESNVLLRSLFEIQYIIIALSKHPNLVKEYLAQEAIEMKKILKNSEKWHNKIKFIELSELEMKYHEVNKLIDLHKLKKYTVKNFAERADLLMDYEINYSILCLSGHSNIYDIKKHFILDDNGIITSFKWGPDDNSLQTILRMATEIMFRITRSLLDVFVSGIEDKYAEYFYDFNELREKIK
jgi:hypothetical protein